MALERVGEDSHFTVHAFVPLDFCHVHTNMHTQSTQRTEWLKAKRLPAWEFSKRNKNMANHYHSTGCVFFIYLIVNSLFLSVYPDWGESSSKTVWLFYVAGEMVYAHHTWCANSLHSAKTVCSAGDDSEPQLQCSAHNPVHSYSERMKEGRKWMTGNWRLRPWELRP